MTQIWGGMMDDDGTLEMLNLKQFQKLAICLHLQ